MSGYVFRPRVGSRPPLSFVGSLGITPRRRYSHRAFPGARPPVSRAQRGRRVGQGTLQVSRLWSTWHAQIASYPSEQSSRRYG